MVRLVALRGGRESRSGGFGPVLDAMVDKRAAQEGCSRSAVIVWAVAFAFHALHLSEVQRTDQSVGRRRKARRAKR